MEEICRGRVIAVNDNRRGIRMGIVVLPHLLVFNVGPGVYSNSVFRIFVVVQLVGVPADNAVLLLSQD